MNQGMNPLPFPGQLWRMDDPHHGNVLAVVEGESMTDVWHLRSFRQSNGKWHKGRDPLAYTSDFASDRMRYVGELPALDLADQLVEMREALRAATAYVELYTGNGTQELPPAWAVDPDGTFNAEKIAAHCRAVLRKGKT